MMMMKRTKDSTRRDNLARERQEEVKTRIRNCLWGFVDATEIFVDDFRRFLLFHAMIFAWPSIEDLKVGGV